MGLILLIIVCVLMFGAAPQWGYHQMGYAPSGLAFVLVVILAIALLSGRL